MLSTSITRPRKNLFSNQMLAQLGFKGTPLTPSLRISQFVCKSRRFQSSFNNNKSQPSSQSSAWPAPSPSLLSPATSSSSNTGLLTTKVSPSSLSSSSISAPPRNSQSMSTYISKHYEVDPSELRQVVDLMDSDTRMKSNGDIEVKICRLCDKQNKTKADNIWKLLVRPNGSYHCYRCSSGGSWFQLKKTLQGSPGIEVVDSIKATSPSLSQPKPSFSSFSSTSSSPPSSSSSNLENYSSSHETTLKIPDQDEAFGYTAALFPIIQSTSTTKSSSDDEAQLIRDYLTNVRGLRKEILMQYGVGMCKQKFPDSNTGEWVDKLCITFPWMVLQQSDAHPFHNANNANANANANANTDGSDGSGVGSGGGGGGGNGKVQRFMIQRIKCRALETKGLQRLLPKGGGWGFFGWHTVRDTHREIIITEGEYDAMAVAQAISALPSTHPFKGIPAISLPNGCNSLPTELIPLLERFEKIYLWMDNDKSGRDGCEKFARKLGVRRCLVVRPDADMPNPPKDANDALRQAGGVDIIASMLSSAQLPSHDRLLSFSDLRGDALAAIRGTLNKKLEGSATPSLPRLTSICKGFRRGEFVIFSGPTGSGKTTVLSQISIDFVKQGVPTLWGSFEIKNSRLVQKMLQQYHGRDLELLNNDKLNKLCDDFESLPLKFMNFHGGSDIEEIIEAMDFSVYRDDTQHIILDNLQFLMPRQGMGKSSYGKFDIQDMAIDRFRKFASEKNVNIILVIHPRKEDDGMELKISSIAGTAKATQEADLVIILQRLGGNMFLDVKKNRYDGHLAKFPIIFSPHRCGFQEAPP